MFHGVFEVVYGVGVSHKEDIIVKRAFLSDTVSNIFFVKYYALASAVLLYFDYLLTLPDEVRRIWGSRLTGATILFFLNRYVPLAGYIVILVCNTFAPFPGALSTFSQGLISVILVIRTYALYHQNIWILLSTVSLGCVNVGISAWASSAMTGSLFTFQPLVSCVPILQVPQLDRLRYGWIATFAFDFFIFALTFGRALRLMKSERNSASLARLIARDGSMYFLVMSIMNALNFVFFIKVSNALFSSTTGTNSMVAHVISVCLINRLLLNLRKETNRYNDDSTTTPSTTVTDTHLYFTTRIMGNLTSELMPFDYDEQDASNNSWRSTTRYSGSVSAYSGRSLLFTRSNLSRQTGLTDFSLRSRSAVSSVGTASGSGSGYRAWSQPNAIASGSGQRGGLPPFSPTSDIETPSTAVDETHPFWSPTEKGKSPMYPSSHEMAIVEEDGWNAMEDGEMAIEMSHFHLETGGAPLPLEQKSDEILATAVIDTIPLA